MLKRTLSHLTRRPFDCLILGGNSLASLIAWDATLRGLRVALIAPADFGVDRGANGLSLVQAGFHFWQGYSWQQCRQFGRERQAYLRIAPHLTRPLPTVTVNFNPAWFSFPPSIGTAVKLNQLLTNGRSLSPDPARVLGQGSVIDRNALLAQFPHFAALEAAKIGIKMQEAQILAPNRLLFGILQSAVDAGATAANYLQIRQLRLHRGRVVGAKVFDRLNQADLEIGAKLIIDTCGSELEEVNEFEFSSVIDTPCRQYLVTRSIIKETALHFIMDQKRKDHFSIVPWHDYSIIGPFHQDKVSLPQILDQINALYSPARLRLSDVYQYYPTSIPNPARAGKKIGIFPFHQLKDFSQLNGIHGLFSVRGSGYETERYLAEKVVDFIFTKFKRPSPACRTYTQPIYGGQIRDWDYFENNSIAEWPIEMPPFQIRRYLMRYGNQFPKLFPIFAESYLNGQPLVEDQDVTKAEIIHAVREEMAFKLGDVVLRRTNMGSCRPPSMKALLAVADLMAGEKKWSKQQLSQEIDEVLATMNMMG